MVCLKMIILTFCKLVLDILLEIFNCLFAEDDTVMLFVFLK
jgi:hypothetical protein